MKAPEKPLALRNEKFSLPKKGATLTFPSDDSTKAACNLVFASNYEPSLKNTLMFKLMRDIMQKRVLAVLREHLNIVYSPFVDAQYHGTPQDVCMFRLFIDVANSNYPVMLNEMKKIVEELRTQPVDNSELEKIKRSFIVTKRQALTDVAPAEWKRCLTELIKNGETVADYNNYDDILHGITPQDVLEGFKKYVDFNKLVVLVQKDEKVN
jgi:zinc protease